MFSGVHPNQRLDQDTIPFQRPLYSTLFLDRGVLKQTPYAASFPSAIAINQSAVPVGMARHVISSPQGHLKPTVAPGMSSIPFYQQNVRGLQKSMEGVSPAQTINRTVISHSDVLRTVPSDPCISPHASWQSDVPAPVCEPKVPENRSQTSVGNVNTVHVLFFS